jgi:hypothetical protein
MDSYKIYIIGKQNITQLLSPPHPQKYVNPKTSKFHIPDP